VTRDGKYIISTFPALTFHGFWISAFPTKMTSIRTKTKNHRHSSRERWNPVPRDGKYTTSTSPAPTLHGFWISAIPAKMTSNYTTTITPVIPAGIAGIQ